MSAAELLKAHGLESSYWGTRIIGAEERGAFDIRDFTDANGWTTCACGKQDRRIPRGPEFQPIDWELFSRGNQFAWHIRLDRFLDCAQTLIAIEKRAAEVLAEQGVEAEVKP